MCLSLDQRVLGEPRRLTGSAPMALASAAMRSRTIGPCGGRRCSQWQRRCVRSRARPPQESCVRGQDDHAARSPVLAILITVLALEFSISQALSFLSEHYRSMKVFVPTQINVGMCQICCYV